MHDAHHDSGDHRNDRRNHRRSRAIWSTVLAGTMTLAAVSCGGSTAAPSGPDGTNATTTTEPTTTTTAPRPVSDQSQPKSTFGMAFDDRKLWVSDFYGGQLLAIDHDTGAIIKRYTGIDGIPEGVDDLVVGEDGSLYYTGFNDGSVGRMSVNNVSVVIGGVGTPDTGPAPGAGPIAFSNDGHLYVGRSIIGDGLWEVDPKGETKNHRMITEKLGNVNAFDVASDGSIYGPRWELDGKGALVRIDPSKGSVTEIVSGFDAPIAVKLSNDGNTAYVLSLVPGGRPKVSSVDLATKATKDLATVETPLAENLVVAPDGRIFVSSFNEPVLTVIDQNGSTKKLTIGQPDDAAPKK